MRRPTNLRATPRRATPSATLSGNNSPRGRARRATSRPWRYLAYRLGIAATVFLIAYGAWMDLRVRNQFEGKRWAVPAQIFARPLQLYPAMRLEADTLEAELVLSGYRKEKGAVRRGSFFRVGNDFHIATREFDYWDGREPARRLRVKLGEGQLIELRDRGRDIPLARVDPAVIGRINPAHREDRILVRLGEVPESLLHALLAVEDRRFFQHAGISPRAILRAAWANLRAGHTVQGGSTLTQQLAKNFFLTSERTLARKFSEAAIALILEFRYSKKDILEAYLNEVFLGQQGARSIHGFGLGARYYFGRQLNELNLAEVATLVALVRGPSVYDPRRHPERARQRRNLVLAAMRGQGLIDEHLASRASHYPLNPIVQPGWGDARFPAFIDLVRRQLRRDYRDNDLRSAGLRIFTTLDPVLQNTVQRVLARTTGGLDQIAARHQASLQGAVVVVAPQSGEVLAVAGNRRRQAGGFNRALDAKRPIGSLIKPAVYLAALEQPDRYHLASAVSDLPVLVRGTEGQDWSPRNYDGKSHGSVPLIQALAYSNNLATVRLGLDIGLDQVVDVLQRLGVPKPPRTYPSMLLGAVELSPFHVAQMYHTIASSGFRVPLRAIHAVTDAAGRTLSRYGISVQQALAPESTFLVTRAMQEVFNSGTARGAYRTLSPMLRLAGKTGTTDDLRDSWFAGFSADRLAVVWLGSDDNRPVGLTGASGALRVWTNLMDEIQPLPLMLSTPASVAWHWSDLRRAATTQANCPGAVRLPYVSGYEPDFQGCSTLQPTVLSERGSHQ